MRRRVGVWLSVLFLWGTSSFAQTGNAQLGGIVQDPQRALIPGVSITATNVDTGVTATQVTNEAGAYNFPVLQPGTYRVSAELPGFKKAIQNDVRLPYAGQVRIDFTLEVGTTEQSIEVTVAQNSLFKESSASVGEVLSQERLESLPLVGNNILDLLNTLPGLRSSALGTAFDTINGLGTNTINATRDGLSINDARNPAQIYGTRVLSDTILLPDLIGEVRMILSPVDAELGRGNTQIQISTRSGTNQFRGSASWNVRNSALDANTWTNNHTPFVDPLSGQQFNSTPKNWNNDHQYTVAYGGPVKIPGLYNGTNKTFFYGLWEQNINNQRDLVSTPVLTDTARQGIFRYWSGYNPLGWNPSGAIAAFATPTYPQQATNATLIAVDQNGNPVRPLAAPTSPTLDPSASNFIPYSGNLVCFSVFGNQKLDPSGKMAPFTSADCPGGVAVLPTGRSAWDNLRTSFDSSGLIRKFLELTPHANYFGSGDGLNTGAVRWIRGRKGTNDAVNGLVGTVNLANNKQINLKIDHNFNAKHKVAASWSHQRDDSADNAPGYPDGIYGKLYRRPHTFTVNATSTISARMVNEARFGLNYTLNSDSPPWDSPIPDIANRARDLLFPAGKSVRNTSYQYLALVSSGIGTGGVGTISTANGFMSTTAAGNYQENMLYNWADNLSWTKGKHAFKAGFDWRLPRSSGTGANQAYPTVTLGNASATATPNLFGSLNNFDTSTDPVGYLPGLLNAAPNINLTAARTNVTNLLYYLTGSVGGVSQNYWITGANNVAQGYWDDISTAGKRIRKQLNQEWALFVKDDYKITRRLTLNLGLRWEYYGSPYIDGGFTSAFRDYGYGAFGATRAAQASLSEFNKDPFKFFLHPGNLYLTGYGSSAANPLSCQKGVQQDPLPVSTCDPDALSVVDFVGPGTPNPDRPAIPNNYFNLGPAIGFAYSVPSEKGNVWQRLFLGQTTIRGGYQQTFGAAGQNRSALNGGTEATLANAPGAVTSGTLAGHINDNVFQNLLTTRAITLSDIPSLVPMAPDQRVPGQALNVYSGVTGPGAGVNWNVYDPHLKTPYTQNITLSVTREINPKFIVDVRYTGTLGRKLLGSIDINHNNVYYNPELFQALTDARAGTCTANAPGYQSYRDKGINPCDIAGDPVLLDQMLAGLNLNTNTNGPSGQGAFGAVGTVNAVGIFQSGAQQLRKAAAFQNNLSWGNFDGVANSLIALAPTAQQGRQAAPIDPGTGVAITGVGQTGLRNGCDRIANGFTIVQQTTRGGPQVANSGAPIPLRCFPEDWLHANPQFGSITDFFGNSNSVIYNTNTGRSSYNAMQVQFTARPISGISTQTTWIWAKSFNVPGSGYIDPVNRNLNYGIQAINPHQLRMNGTVELPIGPNKPFFNNASGWIARALERWQVGFIYNAATGTPATFNPGVSHFYAVSGYDVVSPNWSIPEAHTSWNEGTNTGSLYGNQFVGVTDPSCYDASIVTMGDKMGTVMGRIGTGSTATGPCTISALAKRNPDGTAGEILLQYPAPGKVGTLGRQNLRYFGQWSLDMNASKTFRVGDNRSIALRVDATNVLNHPVPNLPSLSAASLGVITGKTDQVRNLQAQVRINF